MLLLLDTANIEEIKKAFELFPMDGVTTNPTIIAREKKDFVTLIKNIRDAIGRDKMLHVQIIGTTAEEMVEEAIFIKNEFGENTFVKIPVTSQGMKAMKILKEKDINITATAIFSAQQALMAAKAGAKYVAPYVNRMDNISTNGTDVVKEIMDLFHLYNIETKILAASFKNLQQVRECSLSGCHAITADLKIVENLIAHPLTDKSVEQFIRDWENQYGKEKKINEV